MPQMDFTPENKSKDPAAFPKVRLEKDGRERIACLENPDYGYCHRLAAPKVVNDQPVYEPDERNGGTRMVMDFIGRPMCLGDLGTLSDKGSDTKRCPACRKATETERVGPAQRRFAMHVVCYSIQPGGFIVANPFSISVKVWAFADTIFNKLADFKAEWGPLSRHDLMLGPCTNVNYQKYDIAISAKAEWFSGAGGMTAKETQVLTARAFQGNKCLDLSVFNGRRVPESFMTEDIQRVENRWRIVDRYLAGQKPEAASDDHDAALNEGLTGLLDDNPVNVAGAAAKDDDVDVNALLAQAGVDMSADQSAEREIVKLTLPSGGPTAQDKADIQEMQKEIAASSAEAKAGAPAEVSVDDILSEGTADPTPEPSVQSAVTSAASTAKPGTAEAPEEIDDFAEFLKTFDAQ